MKDTMNIANAVTLSRIVFAGFILFSEPFSMQFYILYLLGAFTDMIDGTIARKLNLKSSFGAKLDSVADCIFAAAVLGKICDALYVPGWVWIWIALIAFIKIVNLLSGLFLYHRLASMHTAMNRIAGVLLFLLPLIIRRGSWHATEMIVIVTGLIATFAAVQEGHYIRTGREIE